jgi:hypothetical protein
MFAGFLLTNYHSAREHGGLAEMADCTGELISDCLCQRSNKHRRRHDLQGHWVHAKDARAGRDQYASEG